MSRFPLSPSQAAAVHHGEGDACVLAGAGSGKTVVLAERFVHLVRTRDLGVREIAALTFTEKAAGEMRERIARTFEAAGMHREAAEVEFAQINTIHGFCARLLRLHAVDAGVDPAFGVLEAGEGRLLLEDALALAEDDLEDDDAALRVRLVLPGQDPSTLLLQLYGQLRGAGVAPEDVRWHRQPETGSAGDGPMSLDERVGLARTALTAFLATEDDVPDAYRGSMADLGPRVAEGLARQRAIGASPDAEAALEAAFQPAALAVQVARFKPKPTKRTVTKARGHLASSLEAIAAARLDALGRDRVLPAVQQWMMRIDLRYRELKDERAVLDFTDLELETLRLLERLDARGRAPDLAPRALLVDEYQDTNPLQARILGLLRRPGVSQFSVGDPKQSIYRFRRADVGVILAEQEAAAEDARFELATSYRTHPALLERINALEAQLFEGGNAGVAYNPLEAGGTFAEAPRHPFEVSIVDAGSGASIDAAREAEARFIARRIQELVGGEVRTKGEHAGVQYRFGDVALLFRARSSIRLYEQALLEAGVPYLTLAGSGYLEAEEIEDLLFLLRAIHNPADEHALARVLTGPAFAATDADLLAWFDGSGEGAYARVQRSAREGGAHAPAADCLERLRRLALEGNLADVLQGVLRELEVLATTLLAGEGGYRRAANLRKAIHLASRLEARGERGLGDLLRYLEDLRARGVAESEAAVGGEEADVVRLTTVHGSKGLEYPVVFLADAGRTTPARGSAQGLLAEDGALALRLKDPIEGATAIPAGRAALETADKEAEARERERLLYVALTRAEERLFVSIPCVGFTKSGTPSRASGWGRAIFDCLDAPDTPGEHVMPIGGTDILVHIVDADEAGLFEPPEVDAAAPREDERARLQVADLELADPAALAPLGGTRFVVTVSELLRFAKSPRAYYEEFVLLGDRVAASATHGGQDGGREPGGVDDPSREDTLGRAALRDRAWDEAPDAPRGADKDVGVAAALRATVGSAVHAAVDAWIHDPESAEPVLHRGLGDALGDEATPAVRRAGEAMLARFVASDMARDLRAAQARGDVVRSELDFHARIRFPGGEPVAGFEALLVKGSIDLWLPTESGVWVIDHKTNRRSARFPTPESLAAFYGPQLRLYALAAERLLGQDLERAGLLLLDPSWGEDALFVEVPIDGDRLEETRRLCQAFAESARQGRYPDDWRSLLPGDAPPG